MDLYTLGYNLVFLALQNFFFVTARTVSYVKELLERILSLKVK